MVTTYYDWDRASGNVASESDGTGATTVAYTHRPEQYGKLISQRRDGVSNYYRYDGQGSTRALTDSSGNVTDTYTYSAFGETIEKTGSTTNPFGYKGAVGYYANPVTDDIYVRARMYEPGLGRWMSVDPLVVRNDVNVFRYSFNSPAMLLDPSGLAPPLPTIDEIATTSRCFRPSYSSCPTSNPRRPTFPTTIPGPLPPRRPKPPPDTTWPLGGSRVWWPPGIGRRVDPPCPRRNCRDECRQVYGLGQGGYPFLDCFARCNSAQNGFRNWYLTTRTITGLPACPCSICYQWDRWNQQWVMRPPKGWRFVPPLITPLYIDHFHPGARWDLRSNGSPSQQCTYDKNLRLITHGAGAGTADIVNSLDHTTIHHREDAEPADWAIMLDHPKFHQDPINPTGCWWNLYLSRRPIDAKNNCPKNP